ncbi:hypothetical protein ACSTG8_23720, partial [Vibrio parahaemolyticus]
GHTVTDAPKLPLNLLDAIRNLEKDTELCELLGPGFVKSYAKLKRAEWDAYSSHLTQWERDNTLDI